MDVQTTNSCCTNCSDCTMEVGWGVAYSFVFVLGLLVNAAALRAFVSKRNAWTDTHVYMFNLVVADTGLVAFLPFRIYDAFFCLPKTLLCSFLIFTHFVNMYASIWTAAAISVHQFLLIAFPMRARSWKRKKTTAAVVCLALWGLLVALCVIYREKNHPDKLWTCYERREDQPIDGHLVAFLTLGFLVPLLILVACFTQIGRTLRKVPDSVEKKRVVSIMRAKTLVFVLCFTPVHVGFLINSFYDVPPDWECAAPPPAHVNFLVSEWIASTNCCFDSVGYYFLLKSYYK